MNRRTAALAAGLTLCLGMTTGQPGAVAKEKALQGRLVGEWSLVSVYNLLPDGKKIEPNGPNPKGMFVFGRNGKFSVMLLNPDVPRLASNNRQIGSPEEFKAVAQGVLAYFGTYSIDKAPNTILLHVDYSSFPNMSGTNGKREVKIEGSQLLLINPIGASGGTAYTTWRRL